MYDLSQLEKEVGFRWFNVHNLFLRHLLRISVIWLVMLTALVFMTSCFRSFQLEKHEVTGEYCLCSSSEIKCAVN